MGRGGPFHSAKEHGKEASGASGRLAAKTMLTAAAPEAEGGEASGEVPVLQYHFVQLVRCIPYRTCAYSCTGSTRT